MSLSNAHVFYGDYEPGMSLCDPHVHTRRSDGWFTPEALAEAAVEAGLSAIGVTDHDDIAAGYAVREICARRGLPLVVYAGQEVSARTDGHDVHILGLDLTEEIEPWQSVEATIEAIRKQGGFVIMPHPKAPGRGWPTFEQVLSAGGGIGVEIYNAGVADLARVARARGRADANEEARSFYEQHREQLGGAVGGTDAHFRSIGRGLTAYRGDFRAAVESGETAVLYRPERELLRPWDPIGYWRGLRRLDDRRSRKYGPRPR